MCVKTPDGCRQCPGASGQISSMHQSYPTEVLGSPGRPRGKTSGDSRRQGWSWGHSHYVIPDRISVRARGPSIKPGRLYPFGRRMNAGQTTPIQIDAGSRKRSNHVPRWNDGSAPSYPFRWVPKRTTSGRMEQGSARNTGRTCARVRGGATYLLVSVSRIPGIWRH